MTTNAEIAHWEIGRESGGIKAERCKSGEHVPGTEVVDPAVGETMYGGSEYWAALRDGETVTALCARCGTRLEVSLRVRAQRG